MSTPYCPDCIHSAMVPCVHSATPNRPFSTGETLMCGMFNAPCSPLTAQDCTDFERCAGADGEESEAHRVWYREAE